jgi:hypothetical protein
LAILGGAFGYGLKRNILDAYKFICRNYDHANGSKIYLFGFSRGAFTVSLLLSFLSKDWCRLIPSRSLHNGAVRAYRANGYHSNTRIEVVFRALRDYMLVPILDAILRRKSYSEITQEAIPTIEFIGVWDTVAAYGPPMDEMTRGISNWVWPLELPNRTSLCGVLRAFLGDFLSLLSGMKRSVPFSATMTSTLLADMVTLLPVGETAPAGPGSSGTSPLPARGRSP